MHALRPSVSNQTIHGICMHRVTLSHPQSHLQACSVPSVLRYLHLVCRWLALLHFQELYACSFVSLYPTSSRPCRGTTAESFVCVYTMHMYIHAVICSCKDGSRSIFQQAAQLWPAEEHGKPAPDLAKLSICGKGEAKEVRLQ